MSLGAHRECREQRWPSAGGWLSGKWRLDRLLGRGGMSSVYAATHRNGNQVAIKILHPELASQARLRQRFLREGYIANRVAHPDAVRVLDDGQDGPCAFLVMELLRGQDLESLRSGCGGTLPVGEVVWLTERILAILDAAHAADVIHRDIKPQNLFVTVDGRVKLLDFGVASLRGVPGFTTLTDTAVLPGTPGYMAPEQVRGHQHALGPHTDIWGLGATLFRLLTGQAIYLARTPGEMMVATATQPARAILRVRPDLPSRLAEIVDKALASNPGSRWPSAEAVRVALAPLQATRGLRAVPISAQSCSDTTWDASRLEQGRHNERTHIDELGVKPDVRGEAASVERVPAAPKRRVGRVAALLGASLTAVGLSAALTPVAQRAPLGWRAAGPSWVAAEGVATSERALASAKLSAHPSASAAPPATAALPAISAARPATAALPTRAQTVRPRPAAARSAARVEPRAPVRDPSRPASVATRAAASVIPHPASRARSVATIPSARQVRSAAVHHSALRVELPAAPQAARGASSFATASAAAESSPPAAARDLLRRRH